MNTSAMVRAYIKKHTTSNLLNKQQNILFGRSILRNAEITASIGLFRSSKNDERQHSVNSKFVISFFSQLTRQRSSYLSKSFQPSMITTTISTEFTNMFHAPWFRLVANNSNIKGGLIRILIQLHLAINEGIIYPGLFLNSHVGYVQYGSDAQ